MLEPIVTAPSGDGTTPWYSSLPDAFTLEHDGKQVSAKEIPFIKDSPDLPSALKRGYDNHIAFQRLSDGAIKLPAKEAKDEDRATWKKENLKKLADAGVLSLPPESPDKYEFQKPEGAQWNDSWEKKAREGLHKAGLSNDQFKAALALHNEFMAEANGDVMAEYQVGMEALKKDWGPEPLKTPQAELAARAGKFIFASDPKAEEFINRTGIGNHPLFLRVMEKVGGTLAQDNGFLKTPAGGGGANDAMAEIKAMQIDPTHHLHKAWKDKGLSDPEVEALYKRAHGTKEVEK